MLISLLFPLLISAQSKDTIPLFTTSTIVVTADRSTNSISNSTSAVSVIQGDALKRTPGRSYLDALSVSLFTMFTGGTYNSPVISPRGYYGGGEADYALMQVNGISLNNAGSGLAEWDLIPSEYINKIEVLRGGSSSLYGDAALGGVINLVTDKKVNDNFTLSLLTGSYNYYRGYLSKSGSISENSYRIYLSPETSEGFRKHSRIKRIQFGGELNFIPGNSTTYSLSTYNMISDENSPGPVSRTELASDRNTSEDYYKADGSGKNIFNVIGLMKRRLSPASELSFSGHYKYNKYDVTRTTTNASPIMDPSDFSITGIYDTSFYGDTKLREYHSDELNFALKYIMNYNRLKLVAGSDLSLGWLNSRHFEYFSGFKEDYKNSFSPETEQSTDSRNTRTNYSLYLSSESIIIKPLRLVLGIRYDLIKNNQSAVRPDTSINNSTDAFSPKAGLNFQFIDNKSYSGNLYFSYNRSFKAPTADQLTDLSRLKSIVFVPAETGYFQMPFYADPFSNSELKPQTADNFETGIYQKLLLGKQIIADLSLSVYDTRIKDEIDFDLNTFRYQNIHKTKHTGLEAMLNVIFGNWSFFSNYAMNRVTFEGGELKGNRLKGIPQDISAFGIYADNLFGFNASLVYRITGRIYLDDENTNSIDGYSSTDIKAGYSIGALELSISATNLFDEKYNHNGFQLNGIEFYYPAAGRILTGGVRIEF